MLDLTKKALPRTVRVGGKAFPIHTDYRVWMKFVLEYQKWAKEGFQRTLDIKYLFTSSIPIFTCVEDYLDIMAFAFPLQAVPHSENEGGEQVLFYDIDGDYIYAAFLQQYGIDLIDKELHWHKFLALLHGITEDTKLGSIMAYRSYTGESTGDMKAQYRKLKEAWLPPVEPTEEELAEEERFNRFFD
ncbi:MAG: bacteriophage Gp15 family protein [Roseburia sp.]|nr:bacteriophage Gp15 family protein [Roseburia sp.]